LLPGRRIDLDHLDPGPPTAERQPPLAVVVHEKVRVDGVVVAGGGGGVGQELHTGRLFFSETVTTAVAKVSPYSTNTVTRTTLAQDSIYDDGGAASGLLTLTALGGSASSGYAGTLTLCVEQS
jgi:hypothetical protein